MRPNPTLKPTAVFGVQASLLVNSSRPNHLERSEHPTGRLLGQTTGYTLGLRLHSAARRLFLSPFLHSPFARSFTARCSSLFSFLFSFFLFFLPPVSLRFCSVSVISFCLSTHRHFHLLESFRASDQPTPASLATYFVFISIFLKEKERKKKEKKIIRWRHCRRWRTTTNLHPLPSADRLRSRRAPSLYYCLSDLRTVLHFRTIAESGLKEQTTKRRIFIILPILGKAKG